jgi:hypothetical protein
LGWPKPTNILDLFTEFRDRTNGLELPAGAGLIGALAYFGLDTIGSQEKTEMRELAMRGGFYTEDERGALLGLLRKRCGCARSTIAGHAARH